MIKSSWCNICLNSEKKNSLKEVSKAYDDIEWLQDWLRFEIITMIVSEMLHRRYDDDHDHKDDESLR